MSNLIEDILHEVIDAVSGMKNIPPHRAAELHEQITPGYNDVPLSTDEQAQLEALLARAERLRADQAAREAPAEAPAAEAPAAEAAAV